MARELIGLRAYARRRGVALSAVQKAIKSGRITPIDGKIDPEVADIQWDRNTDPALAKAPPSAKQPAAAPADGGGEASDPVPGEFLAAKARREAALAEIAELDLAVKRGELVRAEEVERQLVSRIIGAREALDSLADRLATLLASESDPAVIHRMLRAEHRQALESLAGEKEAPPEPEEAQA